MAHWTAQFGSLTLRNDVNLQAYYKLEDVTDEVGANDLTNNNSCTFVAAKFNNGVSGGTTDANKSLTIASSLGYGGGAYAISLWLKLNTEIASGNYDITEITDVATDTSLILSYEYNGGTRQLNFQRLRAGVAGDSDVYTVTLGTTDINHLVITYDGSTVKGYLNNVEVASVASTGNGSSALTAVFALLEGRTVGTNNTLGIIDDVALFDRNLTAAEVTSIYMGLIEENDYAFIM